MKHANNFTSSVPIFSMGLLKITVINVIDGDYNNIIINIKYIKFKSFKLLQTFKLKPVEIIKR